MRHLKVEEIMTYVDGQQTIDQAAVKQHLDACGECAELQQELRQLVNHLREDHACEPPSDLVRWGIELFQPVIQPSIGGRIRKIIAALVFDTFEQPALAGMRRVGAPPSASAWMSWWVSELSMPMATKAGKGKPPVEEQS